MFAESSMLAFPFTLAEFKNSLAASRQFGGNFPLSNSTNNNQNIGQMKDDENSADNSSSNLFHTLSNLTTNPDLIQANVEKAMISDALEIVSNLPVEVGGSYTNGNDGGEDVQDSKIESDSEENVDDFLSVAEITMDQILPESVTFTFQVPNSVPSYLNAHYTCETGSRLLFSTVLWIGKIPLFSQLPTDLQNMLLKSTWPEIFLLNLSQMVNQVSFTSIMTSLIDYFKSLVVQEKTPLDRLMEISEHITLFNEFIRDFERLRLDDFEYAALRVILLFNAKGVRREFPKYRRHLDRILDLTLSFLRNQIDQKRTDDSENDLEAMDNMFAKILLKSSTLACFNAQIVEEIFFSNLVGQVQVDSVIPYIIRLGHTAVRMI